MTVEKEPDICIMIKITQLYTRYTCGAQTTQTDTVTVWSQTMTKDFLKLLSAFISFRSVSTDAAFKPEISKTVEWLLKLLSQNGFQVKSFSGPLSNPVVFAQFNNHSPKTVLVYGHYDVQPADPTSWLSDPFTLTSRNGRLWGRGVLDNKGQILIHIFTILKLIKENKLAYNIKFLVEGNEETSNPDLPGIMRKYKSRLKSDYVLVSDGEMVNNFPVLEASLRGGFNLTLKYTTAKNNLHSGIAGGAVPNAALELSRFLSTLPKFTGLYQNVDPITPAQKANNRQLLKISADPLEIYGVKKLLTEPGLDVYTQTGLRPTLQVTGLKSGYIDTGYANIVPATAEARINFRLVASQDPQKVLAAFKKFVKSKTPSYVKSDISSAGMHHPVKLDTSKPIFKSVQKILNRVYGRPPLLKYVGGAIPFISDVKNIFGIDAISISLGNEDCNMHGANENFRLDLVEKGLEVSRLFFSSDKI